MKLLRRRDSLRERRPELARELGVAAVFDATEPLWYSRLTARFRLNWRREAAAVLVVFLGGLVTGLALAHH